MDNIITFNIKSLNLVFTWNLNVDCDNCELCKKNLHDIPTSKYNSYINSDSPVTKGMCGCHFHSSCISGWRKEYDTCPKCQVKFILDNTIKKKIKLKDELKLK